MIALVAIGACAPLRSAPAPVTLLSNSLLDTKGLLGGSAALYSRNMNGQAFQNDILVSHNGWQYTAWYDTVGTTQNMLLARRAILGPESGPWQVLDTGSDLVNGDEPSWNAHNTISLGIDHRDGTLHLAWDHHVHNLRYRRSLPGLVTYNDAAWGSGLLHPEQNWLISSTTAVSRVTYPVFFNAPDGGLFFNFRDGNSTGGNNSIFPWSPTAAAYSSSHLVTTPVGSYTGVANSNEDPGIFTSTSRNAYANGWDFDANGVLHYTWTWRERTDVSSHDICYAYSPDRGVKWYNNAGALIADNSRSSGPSVPANITVASPGIVVVPLNGRQSLINQQAQTVDPQGRVHVVCTHRRDEPGFEWKLGDSAFTAPGRAYYHYFRDPVTHVWTRRQLPLSHLPGSRPDLEATANGDLYAVYRVAGSLVVAGATAAAGYEDWTILATHEGGYLCEPRLDHVRLRRSGVLSVLVQEDGPLTVDPVPVPIRVLDYALGPVFEAFAGQDRRLVDYDRDGLVAVALEGRVGADADLAAASHRWRSDGIVLATTAAPTLTLGVGRHTLTYEAATGDAAHVATDTVVVEIFSAAPITASASSHNGNVPENTLDGNLDTRWSAQGLGEHITWDLGDVYLVRSLAIGFYLGDQRISFFDLEFSLDGLVFYPLLPALQSSGVTLQPEVFDFPDFNTRYLRLVGRGNTQNNWISLTEMTVVRDSFDPDLDDDGLDDLWERLFFGSLDLTATADPDGDGYDNLSEFLAGSSPIDPDATPLDTDADGLPDAWEKLHFNDLRPTASGDFDGDGFDNLAEFSAGTSPANPASTPLDRDADGLLDAWEQLYFGSLAQTGSADPDGDGTTNLAEFLAGSSPINPASTPLDTDSDDLPDAWETHHFGSLAHIDADDPDRDGFDNLTEYLAAADPANPVSHPLDSDGDGLPDALSPLCPFEVDEHTLHLWHLDELTPPFANAANPAHPLRGLLNGATAWLPGPGGFGASVNVNTGAGTERGIVTYAAALSSATTPDTPNTFVWHGADGAFTLEALVKLDSLVFNASQIIAFDGDGDGTQDRVFQFRLHALNGAPTLGFVPIASGVTGNYEVPLPTSGAHAPDTESWFHAAVTYDGRADIAGNLKLYWTRLDSGATQANLLGGSGRLSADFNQTIHQGDFSIGNEARATNGHTGVLPGRIDEVRISSIARGPGDFFFKPHDIDADDLPDSWEMHHFGRLDAATATSDHDGDGTPDRLEWLLGLDPGSGAQAWRMDLAPAPTPALDGGFTLTWPARAGLRFRVERATDLAIADWTTQATVTARGASATWTDPAPPAPRAFYRVALTLP